MNGIKEVSLKIFENENIKGNLSYFEVDKHIHFCIKRVYYIYNNNKNSTRGYHAHKKLHQAIWCPYGEIEIVFDNGYNKEKFVLDRPDKILIVTKGYWREMIWKKDNSVLCVAASDVYDENDYIRDYEEFKTYIKDGFWDYEN